MPVNIALLTGSTKTRERKKILEALLDGTIQLVVGTHAVIEDKVQFKTWVLLSLTNSTALVWHSVQNYGRKQLYRHMCL